MILEEGREAPLFAGLRIGNEDVVPKVAQIAAVVLLVIDAAGDPNRRRSIRGTRRVVVRRPRAHEGELPAIGRPRELDDGTLAPQKLTRFAAVEREEVDGRVAAPVGDESEGAPIGRKAR